MVRNQTLRTLEVMFLLDFYDICKGSGAVEFPSLIKFLLSRPFKTHAKGQCQRKIYYQTSRICKHLT